MVKKPKNNTTLKDVAQLAGVSTMAVSKVLNNKGGISKETSARILSAAEQLGYVPNLVAKSLRVGGTKTIGVILSDCSEFLYAQILKGIEDVASESGFSVIMANSNANTQDEKKAVTALLNKRIDGLILVAPINTSMEDMQIISNFGIPFVVLMRSTTAPFASYVINDNVEGGKKIVEHILKKNVQNIAFITLPLSSESGAERKIGYQKAYDKYHLNINSAKMLPSPPSIEGGFSAMNTLLDDGFASGAVCCGCDLIAVGAIDAIEKRGLNVPDDIIVTGYDDINFLDYFKVPVTTICQPKYEIGSLGAKILVENIESKKVLTKRVVLKNELIERLSTKRREKNEA